MSYVSFQEMKPRVGIDDVAFSLGYKLNRQAGVGRYIELILPDGRGEKLDTIVISHPQEKDRQRYFHRNIIHTSKTATNMVSNFQETVKIALFI